MGLEMINVVRKRLGISLQELSEKSGVPMGTLSKITAGITEDPKIDTVRAIAHALGCTIDDFVDDDKANEKATPEQIRSGINELLDKHGILIEGGSKEISQKQRDLIIKMINIILESDI